MISDLECSLHTVSHWALLDRGHRHSNYHFLLFRCQFLIRSQQEAGWSRPPGESWSAWEEKIGRANLFAFPFRNDHLVYLWPAREHCEKSYRLIFAHSKWEDQRQIWPESWNISHPERLRGVMILVTLRSLEDEISGRTSRGTRHQHQMARPDDSRTIAV